MAVLKNRAKMSTSTTGTGTITLSSAEDGYQSFADAGVANADVVRYVIEDGNNFEIGTGTYTSSGTTLTRTVSESSNSDAAINLSGSATVFIGATAEDIQNFVASTGTATAPNDNVSIAIGGQAVASGTNSISLQRANSSGLDSIAAAIGNTTSSYGAHGSNSISIGALSKATTLAGTAVGYGANSTHTASSAFGTSATTTANSQVALGGSGYTVRISGAYTLPTADGSANQVLTTDGSGAVTFADAGGSIGGNTGVDFNDNVKARFGTGNDFEIYHDGTTNKSHITESGASHLIIQGQEIQFDNAAGTSLLNMSASQIEMFHSGNKKLETTSSGIQTTGTVNVNNAYTLPTSDGSNGQVLTTNGSGAVTFADAGGGGSPDLFSENYTSGTKPATTGTNAVAIGKGSSAAGTEAIAMVDGTADSQDSFAVGGIVQSAIGGYAIGKSAQVYSQYGLALGKSSLVTAATDGTAVGVSSVAGANSAVAFAKSRASGADSLAGAIANNSTSYGASGANSIALGQLSKATATNSIAIGDTAISTTANQIALGGTTDTVKISGTYTLPTSDGTNGQVLTTDGSGAVTFADAGGGGGADLYIANPVSATDPTAAGDNAVGIGDGADATGNDSIAIGTGTIAGLDSVAIGLNAASGTTTGSYNTSIGRSAASYLTTGSNNLAVGRSALQGSNLDKVTGSGNAAIGYGAGSKNAGGNNNTYLGTDAGNAITSGSSNTFIGYNADGAATTSQQTALGYQAETAGTGATAINNSYASGTDSFAANISSNSSSYGASGSGAAAIMNWAKATGSNSGAFGFGANATNWGAHALGAQTFATGDSSVSLGRNSLASATYSICIGNAGQNNIESSIKFSGSQHANQGDAQIGLYPLMADTTDATATAMVTNHATRPGASTVNQIVLPNNSAYAFHGTIVARQKAGDGTACAAWKVEGLIRREGSAGTTVLVNSATTVLDNTPNWGMALSADTTNGGLKVQVTGAASTNIRWTTSITTSELTYA